MLENTYFRTWYERIYLVRRTHMRLSCIVECSSEANECAIVEIFDPYKKLIVIYV